MRTDTCLVPKHMKCVLGSDSGLRLTVNLEQYDAAPFRSQEAGIMVIQHFVNVVLQQC